MDKTDKQEILEAIATFSTQVEERMGGMEQRMGGMEERMSGVEQHIGGMEERMDGTEERIGSLVQEMRRGFDGVDKRLTAVEDSIAGMTKSLDTILEGDVLGKDHITLERHEYDTMVDSLHLPNRFESAH